MIELVLTLAALSGLAGYGVADVRRARRRPPMPANVTPVHRHRHRRRAA